MTTWIKNKRKDVGISQTDMAQSLGISRPTYVKIEEGEILLTPDQKVIITSIFNVSRESLEKNSLYKSPKEEISVREIPKENKEKFKQVLLYIVSKVGGLPNIGQTALYKLLYFIDFDYYEKNQKYLIGATYIKNTYGPTPISFAKISQELQKSGGMIEVTSKHFNYDQKKYLITKEPDVTLLTAPELQHVDFEIQRLSSKTAKELSELSHIDTPWRVAGDKQILNYRHVFYRPDETSFSDQ